LEIASDLAACSQRIQAIAVGPVLATSEFGELVGSALDGAGARISPPPASRRAVDGYVQSASRAAGLDPHLVEAVIAVESGFDPSATSSAGARGLMQLMPQTAMSLGVRDAYDPEQNVRAGARYLRSLLDRFGAVDLAVAAYNAGPAAVERYGAVPPYPETQAYVRNVLARYRASAAVSGGVLNSDTRR